eukprot:Hpha_TRINITY_DN28538_c0_g1::TRINITY_DN28538_c0_g1_i1::g.18585::m.18585
MLRVGLGGAVIGVGALALSQMPVGERKMWRGIVGSPSQSPPAHVRPYLLWGYKWVPLQSLDEVSFSNEVPWERHPASPAGVLLAPEIVALAPAGLPGEGKMDDAIFETQATVFGGLAPLTEYSNFEVRRLRRQL